MEFVKVSGTFNEEDEEIVESMESNITQVEKSQILRDSKFYQGTSFSGFSTWGDVAIQLKLQAIEKRKQKQLGDFLLEVVK